ncbi:hypothetical protein [Micromonospora sp. WMMD1082]|uniref:hypothetical protein n=1 Tax=Micromonospora sp. WMMD1082 TaxID=3016104 RepID=UPI002415FB26|nr:hypothetical protein [Micromonospora sp. WMMD1082]MDG4795384.1 hypothetical protein [Micromonospora sp. WMMD1082]
MRTHQPPSPAHEKTTTLSDGPDEAPDIIAVAWPTGRPIRSYTIEELAEGVDLYTRAMKTGVTRAVGQEARDAR